MKPGTGWRPLLCLGLGSASGAALAAEGQPTRNPGIKSYEFPETSGTVVWWRDAAGREWQESIRARVLAATAARADGDACPYG